MIIERLWVNNSGRNFNYLIACPQSGQALAVDPLDHQQCLARARERGWDVTQVLNTHEHFDHTGGNRAMIAATGARLLAHANAGHGIPGIDAPLAAGDVVRVGNHVELEVLDTPGHTMSHVCLLAHTDQPALFCGDTLFNAGAGNCHNGGRPEALYQTFAKQLAHLPDHARVYPGHEYMVNNLRFTLSREPGNAAAQALLDKVRDQDPAAAPVTTIGQEKTINTFFRLANPELIDRLRVDFPSLPAHPGDKAVFLKLRELRNQW